MVQKAGKRKVKDQKKTKKSVGNNPAAKQKPAEALSQEVLDAREKAREALRKKFKNRQRVMKAVRTSGLARAREMVEQIHGDGSAENADMVEDIAQDLGKMKGKDSKDYLKTMVDSMSDADLDGFVNMVKTKMPGDSKDILNYVDQRRKLKEEQSVDKPQVNEETKFKTVDTLTEEEKAKIQAERKESDVRKKKKTFSKINTVVPKLSDLQGIEVPDQTKKSSESNSKEHKISIDDSNKNKKKKKKGFKTHVSHIADPSALGQIPLGTGLDGDLPFKDLPEPSQQEKKAIIHPVNSLFDKSEDKRRYQQLSLAARTKKLNKFRGPATLKEHDQIISGKKQIRMTVTVKSIQWHDLPDILRVPDSEGIVEEKQVPEDILAKLKADPEAVVPSHDNNFCYQYDLVQKDVIYKSINAHNDSKLFFDAIAYRHVKPFLNSLPGKQVVYDLFMDQMWQLGILKQKNDKEEDDDGSKDTWTEHFQILTTEYITDNQGAQKRVSAPVVPWFSIEWSI